MKPNTFVTKPPRAPVSRRRQLVQIGLTLPLSAALPAHAETPIKATIQRATIDGLVTLIYSHGENAWAVTKTGRFWERIANAWRLVSAAPALDPNAPLVFAHGRLVGRSANGGLWVREGASPFNYSVTDSAKIAPHSSTCPLAFAIIGVVSDEKDKGKAWLVRFESSAKGWAEVARSSEPVMPDASPMQLDLDAPLASALDGHIVVFAGPDSQRYRHAILGDGIEATRLIYLERHSLKLIRAITLDGPYVFEDIAPRALDVPGKSARRVALLTLRSGPNGAQLALLQASATNAKTINIVALADPIGTANRWIAPMTNGEQILAVHTPHIGGVLHNYQLVQGQSGTKIKGTQLHSDLSNHIIGSRETDLSQWFKQAIVIPSQNLRKLRVFSAVAPYDERGAIELPSTVVQTAAMHSSSPQKTAGLFALLASGGLMEVNW